MKPDPADTLARTVWAEARGEGVAGMEAVSAVIINRARFPRWWGRDVESVCRAPWQFSCWNSDDPNLPKLRAVTTADPQFRQAAAIAARALAGTLPDPTGGADSYFDPRAASPAWANGRRPVAVIGNHRFYRLEIPAPKLAGSGASPASKGT